MSSADLGCGSVPSGDINLDLFIGFTPHHRASITPMRQGYKMFIRGDVQELPFRDKSLRETKLSHVLEHTEKPLQVLQELNRITRERVLVLVPNNPLKDEHPQHLYSWSRDSLKALAERAGLKVKNIYFFSRPNLGDRQIMRLLNVPIIGPALLRWMSPWISLEIHLEAETS